MHKKHRQLLAFVMATVLTIGLGSASSVLAISVDQTGLTATAETAGVSNARSVADIVGTTVNAVLSLTGVILLLLVIYAGFQWMTAQGEAEKVKKAKATLINAAIGMIIVFSAYSISNYVFTNVYTATQEQGSAGGFEACVNLCAQEDEACANTCAANNP
jgi:hypothetical protein